MPDQSFYVLPWVMPWMYKYIEDKNFDGRAELLRELLYPKLSEAYPEFRAILLAEEKKRKAAEEHVRQET